MIGWILVAAFVVFLALCAFYMFFNRDPAREISPSKNVVSPADGRVIEIIDLDKLRKDKLEIRKGLAGHIKTETEDITKNGYLISIFMTPLDVHVQRAPVEGKVVSTHHKKGKFLAANSLRALIENEKNEIVIQNREIGKIKVIQAAGLVARRIECFIKKNEKLLKGQKIGKINLGSQVVLIIPRIVLNAKVGEKVAAGETVIAQY
ncbi:phosphatidylserine decarboxylase [Candidatus Woesearchaeota archaeon]|nr:phosphatidylserine decarboxylase [Candidatus Woesearchaeota archaeon]